MLTRDFIALIIFLCPLAYRGSTRMLNIFFGLCLTAVSGWMLLA